MVREQGKRFRTTHLEVRFIASLLRGPRIGIIVPKYGRNSVDRNRLKRRLRDIIRQTVLPYMPALDVVFRTRPSAYQAEFADLQEQCKSLRQRVVEGVGS